MSKSSSRIVTDVRGGVFGWWGALLVALVFVLVAKTTTVGAPALASSGRSEPHSVASARPALFASNATHPEPGGAITSWDALEVRAALEERAALESELTTLRSQLAIERRKFALLERSVSALATRVDEFVYETDEPFGGDSFEDGPCLESSKVVVDIPIPIDAIYVKPD